MNSFDRSQFLVPAESLLPGTAGNFASFPRPANLFQPIAPPQNANLLRAEVEILPAEQCLFTTSEYSVFAAQSWQMPRLMDEIGRLREITFRGVGEGTGKSSDI